MSVALGDPSLNLTPQKRTGGFSLFSCCLPKVEELQIDEEEEEHTPLVAAYDIDDNFTKEDTAVTFDLPELGDEVPIDEAAVDGPAETANNVIVAFLQMFLAFLLLNFNEEGQPIMAIKSVHDKDEEEKTEIKPVSQEEELLMSKISENKFQVEDVPQIAAAE